MVLLVNKRKDTWFCTARPHLDIPRVMHIMFMSIWTLSNEKCIMLPPQSFRINDNTYINVLDMVVKHKIEKMGKGRMQVLEQVSTSLYGRHVTQNHFTVIMWPPSSPDLNPINNVRGITKREIGQCSHSIKNTQKATFTYVIANLCKNSLIRACSHFRV